MIDNIDILYNSSRLIQDESILIVKIDVAYYATLIKLFVHSKTCIISLFRDIHTRLLLFTL